MTSGRNDEVLIGRIRADGEANAAAILSEAETYRKQTEARAEVEIAETEALLKAEADREISGARERKKTLAALERRKMLLAAKQRVIDGVYRSALAKLNAMDKAEKLARTDRLLRKYAEEGDEIVLAGTQDGETLSLGEAGSFADTSDTEYICRQGRRLPLVYLEGGKVIDRI